MYGNLIKTIVVSFVWLSLLFAAPNALAIKAVDAAKAQAAKLADEQIKVWNSNTTKQNEMINSYLNSSEGKSDTTAQAQYQQIQANGGSTSTSAQQINANQTYASTTTSTTGTNTGSSSGSVINTGTTTSTSSSTSGMSQQQLLNRQVAKTKDDATNTAMECATEFTQSVDGMTKNQVIGGVPSIVNQYLGTQQIMTAAQLCSWLLNSFNLTRQAQIVQAAASGQLPPAGSAPQQNYGQGFTSQPDYAAVQNQLNTNVQAIYQQQMLAQQQAEAVALKAAEEAQQQREDQALMYMLINGLGGSSGADGEADPILMNMLFQ